MILITRPGEPGRQLVGQLAAQGRSALWWPAFDLLGPGDPQALQACVRSLAEFDLVVFVSPMAVQTFARAMEAEAGARWPVATVLAAVGAATLQAARTGLPGAAAAPFVSPAGDAAGDGGSEALWGALDGLQPGPRHALIVRAQSGRAWLAQRLLAKGVAVQEVEAYRRLEHAAQPEDWAALRSALLRGEDMVALLSSSEAVGVITRQLQGDTLAAAALARGIGLAVHARIAEALHAAGWRDVRRCEPSAVSIEAALGTGPAPALQTGTAGIS